MYIEKLTIKNFRAFDEDGITLQFNKGVNAIIGENNSGKSAVMDAIRIAFSTVTYKKDIFFTRADFHVSEDGNAADFALFDIYLEEVPTRLVEIWNPESVGGQGGEFHIRFERVIAANGIEKVRAIHWGIGTEGNPLSSDTFDAMDVMFLGALRDSENEMKPARNSKLAQLLRSLVPDEVTRAELVDILNSANKTLLEKEELKKTRKTINDNLACIEQDFLSQHVDIGLIEPRFDSIASSLRAWVKPKWILVSISDGEYSRAQQYAREHEDNRKIQQNEKGIYFETSILENVEDMAPELVTRINEIASSSFELYQNGLGYNNLLFMSTVLGDMAIERGGVYQHLLLIEEPEAHLHPQLQELVHTFLSDTNQGDANIQIIFTSHSPTLASKVDIERLEIRWKGEALTIYPDEILQEESIFMEDGTRRIVDLLVSFTKADPAIYVEKWEGQLAIEIKDTHPVDSKKISQMKQKGLACLEFTVSKWNVRENFNNAEDEEKQTIEITEKLDGKNGGYIWGELLVDPISRKYFSTKLYEDEKREKERAIAKLNEVKKLYGQVIDTNKQLREQIQLLDRNINVYKNKLSGFEAKLRVTEQENTEIKSSFWYKLFGKK